MPKLFIVPTPIGNLEDITLRAINTLKNADFILAEDTRTSGNLLKHYDITTKMIAFHQYNEHSVLNNIVNKIKTVESACLITDAGTPGISDPGYLLVRECVKNNIDVECLPGATALIPALVCSGLPCDRFYFEGFLPHKKGRNTKLEQLKNLDQTFVLYESPFRLVKTLNQLMEYLGEDRYAVVAREISKLHEEYVRGSLRELCEHFNDKTVKGEIVIVVDGKNKTETS
ncbi:16S rRNA (cytidine(1402)-2'-O)-methyltransferase [Bacteroidales bacterium OttesenSCG-928-K03]|nr:16S rRNA (cytidine(1402)-2'-O)-methyltransferase [Odoribacter sp. OttesenSCG-928-L07]MDL2239984.1 16S rRNA (cytidine(1402)-2'-O)-methyltransferase [Bacteroidales bacterium OttesenSCG-928-L14]MDL2240042.1 16S rRNA (cytidine(1402)-2'-O)-methyltransferase [Bacteroidales bacterium OttesenSCG-928-K22]MDL2242246.1 16S rRNA (cytidine(1402)-2'-O)-methyltransferase [Bacteroidales bacterium OttesenSCG-928-K03]